jgi:hypothetical protein
LKGLGQRREVREVVVLTFQESKAGWKGPPQFRQVIVITVQYSEAGRKSQGGKEIAFTEEFGDLGRNRGQGGQLKTREVERTRGPCVDSIKGSLVASVGGVHGDPAQQLTGTEGTSIFFDKGSLNPTHPIWNNDHPL